ncbi:DNA-directed RNA-polymerase subunit F [mine drainage metagenome]|uniref:DNA-directed RNA-polymerase subunit F n=1 Tax=mine drainage metagenome TaxID=410659 RepID=T1AJQ4_9ZZZZ
MVEYKYLTISEAFALLSKLELTTPVEKQGLEYLEKFHSLKAAEVKKAIKELSGITDLPDKVVVKIIDLAPRNRESLMVILNSSSINLPEEKITAILDTVKGIVE